MENGPFIDDFPIKTSIYKGFSMAMLNNQMVSTFTVPTIKLSIKPIYQLVSGEPPIHIGMVITGTCNRP